MAVIAISSTNLSVSWLPPQEENGVILRYVIHYKRYGSDQTALVFAAASQRNKVITGLQPFTNYSIMMVANTSAGYGNLSKVTFSVTQQAGRIT